RRGGTLPEPDQPETGEPPGRQQVKFAVRHLVEPGYRITVDTAQLVEPDVHHLGHHDDVRHPVGIGRKTLIFGIIETVKHGVRPSWSRTAMPPELQDRGRARL